jgi:hypothetical protein
MTNTYVFIPYRNRKEQLDYFLTHSWPLLRANIPNVRLVVLEQEGNKLFNRGKLLNVGCKEFGEDMDFIMTQDVDVNPTDSAIALYNAIPAEKEILGLYSSPYKTLGGVIKLRKKDMETINGFPNLYWGWGVEDRALYNRAIHFDYAIKFHIFSRTVEAKTYFTVFDTSNDRVQDSLFQAKTDFEYTTFQTYSKEAQATRILADGINTLSYTIVERKELQEGVEWLLVQL